MIVTISGAGGAGKTTIAGWLLKLLPNSGMVPSYTTRASRSSDIPGEYIYISKLKFKIFYIFGFFLWTVSPYGYSHGTAKKSVNKILKQDSSVGIMLLFGNTVGTLREYAKSRDREDRVVSFYVVSPPREILKERLVNRGENQESIERRLSDSHRQDSEAMSSDVPYIFIRNDETIDIVVDQIIKHISDHQNDYLNKKLFGRSLGDKL